MQQTPQPVRNRSREPSEESPPNGLRLYDFRQPKLVSKEIIRAMRDIHEMYARHIKQIFSGVLNHHLDVTLVEVEQVIFSDYLNELDPPTSIFLFNIEELGDWVVLQMDPGFCIYCVERQSGGTAVNTDEKRRLTQIEEKIMGRVIDRSLKELSHVWSNYISFDIENYIYESKPANIRTLNTNSPGIVIRLEFKFENVTVPFSICYPYGKLKENLLGNTFTIGKQHVSGALNSQQQKSYEEDLKRVTSEVKVLLGQSNVTLDRLINLEEGDLIMLDQQIEDPLDILVSNKLKMNGYPGTMSGKKAVKIFEISKNSLNHQDY